MNTTSKNPYVGPRTFLKEESHLFFGREREARDLTALVASERLVLFYAQSGAGKSSLINTRLIPDLEKNQYEVFPLGRVSGGNLGIGEEGNIYIYNLMRSLVQRELNPASIAKLSLSKFLGQLNEDENGYFYDNEMADIIESEGYTPWRRALIIDQFEEIFSMHLDAWEKREDFFRQLAQAMQDDPYLWVVLVMREDYIAALDPYVHLLPGGLRTRYYMQRLSREAALKAMKNPVEKLRPYADGVAEKLVENLASIKVQRPNGTLEVQPGQYVEPVQLQVVCYGLWENLSPDGKQITEKDLQDVGDVNLSLEKYYDSRVSSIAKEKYIPERLIRDWFGKELITSGGVRDTVLREQNKIGGLTDDVVQTLQGDLVHAEMRAGQMWYELSHDRLIEPILNSNAKWFERNLSVFQRQVVLWLQQGRSESLLLRGRELQKAEEEAKTLAVTGDEQTFLDACRALKKREERDLLQRRIIFIALFVLIGVVAVAVFFAFQATAASQKATVAQAVAEAEKANAVQAQAVAEAEKANAVKAKAEAEQQAEKALAGSLAAQADSIKGSNHALALLLGMEAYQREDNLLTRTTLFQLLQYTPYTRLFGYNGPVSSVAISPDGMIIASTSCKEYESNQCKYGEIILSDALTDQPVAKLSGDYGLVNSLAFHQYDSAFLLAAGSCVPVDGQNNGCTDSKGQITLWDITKTNAPVLLSDIRGEHKERVKTIAFNHDGSLLASGSYDMTIILWDISDPAKPTIIGIPLSGHTSFVNSVAFSSDGRSLVSAGDDQRIILWDTSQLPNVTQLGESIEQHAAPVNSVAFSPDGKKFASASDDNTVILWDWDPASRTLQNPIKLEGHGGFVKSVAFNADGTMLASAGFDNKVILWNTSTGKPMGLPLNVHTKAINAIAFGMAKTAEGSDMPYLISGGDDHVVIQWDLSTRQPLSQPIKNVSPPQGLGLTATNGTLEASVVGQQIQLSGRTEMLTGHTGAVNSLSFSSQIDGKLLLASASDDQTVIIWNVGDVANAAVFLKLESFDNPVSAAYFEGNQLITIENNGEKDVRSIQWNITPSSWLSLACGGVKRNLNDSEWQRYLPNQVQRKTCEANP
jgi:WD40 repeat protein